MKKTLLLALALVLVGTCAMAQGKGKKGNKNAPQVITISSDPQQSGDRADAEEKGEPIFLTPAEVGLDFPMRMALDKRQTTRNLSEEDIPLDLLSSLLWSAYGFNRLDEMKRVVPSAVNVQEFDIYLFTREGIYLYNAAKNVLEPVKTGDHRTKISEQKHFAVAPVSIVIVANYDRMKVFKDEQTRDFYAAVDAGYVSQDIYLFCAGNELGTVACGGIQHKLLAELLGITNGKALLAHPVGRIK